MSKPQRQDSLNAQLGDLMKLAVDEGMYDAHQWILDRLSGGSMRTDIPAIALANVSGALVDSGVVVPEDETQYGEAVRELTAERDRLAAELEAKAFEPLLDYQKRAEAERQRADAAEQSLALQQAAYLASEGYKRMTEDAGNFAAINLYKQRADAAERRESYWRSMHREHCRRLICNAEDQANEVFGAAPASPATSPLRALSAEELAAYKPATSEEIEAALKRGQDDARRMSPPRGANVAPSSPAASPATATWDDSDSDENYAAEGRLRAPYRSDKRTPVKRKSDSLDTHKEKP